MATAGPTLPDIANRLLAHLRAELDDAGVGYRAPPAPLSGGYETRMARFELAGAPEQWSGPLVLRIYAANQSLQRAQYEAAVQNSLADQGYPVPRALFTGADDAIGGPYLIMRFLPGKTMLAAEPQRTPDMLGAAHAALHELDPEPLIDSLRRRGLDVRRFRFGARLDYLWGKRHAHPWLAGALQWLVDSRPPEPDRLSICHGDFHPLNILIETGQVSAVLDWSGFSIGDPVMDVAFTTVLLSIASEVLLPIGNLDALLASYYAAYRRVRPLDLKHLDYYRMVRCVMALVEGAEGQEVWARPAPVARLTEWLQEGTGISVDVPVRG